MFRHRPRSDRKQKGLDQTAESFQTPCQVCRTATASGALDNPTNLDLLDGAGGRTLGALLDGELNLVAFGQGAEAIADDGGLVDEDIFGAGLGRNEAKTLGVIEPLDGASYAVCGGTSGNFVACVLRAICV